MGVEEEVLKELAEAIVNLNQSKAEELAKKCLKLKLPASKVIETVTEALRVVGEKYEKHEYFLPELVAAGVMMSSVLEIIKPLLKVEGVKGVGKVVIGTVKNDIHDLGKTTVIALLRSAGFEVIDLGVDVPPEKFVEAVKKEKPDILGMSALLSTTRIEMKNVIEALKKAGLRDKVKVIVGGGAVTPEYAKEIGADAYGKDAVEAVQLCRKLVRET